MKHPLKPTDPMDHKCTATNRQGGRCKNTAIKGGSVCRMHGGAAPQVLEKARQRLLRAVDPAAAELVEIALGKKKTPTITKDGVVDIPPPAAVQVRAIESIMDRVGLPATVKEEVSVSVSEESRQRLRRFFPYDEEREKQ